MCRCCGLFKFTMGIGISPRMQSLDCDEPGFLQTSSFSTGFDIQAQCPVLLCVWLQFELLCDDPRKTVYWWCLHQSLITAWKELRKRWESWKITSGMASEVCMDKGMCRSRTGRWLHYSDLQKCRAKKEWKTHVECISWSWKIVGQCIFSTTSVSCWIANSRRFLGHVPSFQFAL